MVSFVGFFPSLKLTAILHLKMDGKGILSLFPFGGRPRAHFQVLCLLDFRAGFVYYPVILGSP